MSRKIRIGAFLLLIVITLNMFSVAYAASEDDITQEYISSVIADMPKEQVAQAQYDKFIFACTDEKGIIHYPAYYGGSYINTNGELVIQVVDTSSTTKSDVASKIISNHATGKLRDSEFAKYFDGNTLVGRQAIKYETVKYSYNYLQSILDTIRDYTDKFISFRDGELSISSDLVANIGGYGIGDEKNNIFVLLKSCTKKDIEEFNNQIIKSDAIEFVQGEGGLETQAVYAPGASVASSTSVGYKAEFTDILGKTAIGFTTSGHGYTFGATYSFGKIWAHGNNRDLDLSFVVPSSGNSVSSQLTGTSISHTTGYFLPSTNMAVSLHGMKTKSSGAILSTDYNVPGSFNHALLANYSSVDGDSGGLVYYYYNNLYCVVGSHVGRTTYNGKNCAVVQKAGIAYTLCGIYPVK